MFRTVLFLSLVVLSIAAPRSRNKGPQLVYDQKQSGDYNIQIHLKDFQIVALLGDDSLGGLGDYDYNYDYADFTVKPPSTVTFKPSEDVSTTLKPMEPEISTKITEKPSTTLEPIIKEETQKPLNTGKPLTLLGEGKPEDEKVSTASTTLKEEFSTTEGPKKDDTESVPGQIQVQILETPEGYPNFAVRKDTVHDNESGKSSDVKCSSGFTKDKKGRCRRIRRPQSNIPFNFGRLAHIAAKFRSADKEGPSIDVAKSSSPK